ncbi:unnamed protein product [Auanema sp. JU1783]|nr:unnamed protein product [Auanema sp. JU1783]
MTSSDEDVPLQESHVHLKTPKSKLAKAMTWMKSATLEEYFRLLGGIIGSNPLSFIIAGAILCGLSVFMVNLHLKDNVRDGYTPSTSRSRLETNLYREFLNSDGDPTMTTILMRARDNGSMHRMEYLAEAVQQMVYISKNLSVEKDDHIVTYDQFCGLYCKANQVVSYFYLALVEKMKSDSPNLVLTYPIARLNEVKMHLERNFYGVRTVENYTVTNIEHIELVAMSFLAEVKTIADMDRLNAWELAVYEYCTQYSSSPDNQMEMLVIGAEIVDTEMNKDGQRMTPYFATGFVAMFAFVFVTVFVSAAYFDRLTFKIPFAAFACALVPILAITTTLGLSTLIGNRTNSLMLIMPFLIMGIGVNDSFLTLHSWLRQPLTFSPKERIARVLLEVGPSITTTTLTNVVTFMIGWFTPTEEISIFCLGSALALGFAYIYTLIIYCPILYYCSQPKVDGIEGKEKNSCRIKTKRFLKSFVHYYCRLLEYRPFVIMLVIGSLFYWYFGIIGSISMSAKLDTGKILPMESPVRRPNRFIEGVVWKEYYPVTIIVNNPVDIGDEKQLNRVLSMVNDFENIPTCKGTNFTTFWLRDYQEYFTDTANNLFDYYDDDAEMKVDNRPFGFSKLSAFFKHILYSHNLAFVKYDPEAKIPVRKFSLLVVYENSTSWDNRIELMQEWRKIADNYKDLNVSVWNVNAMFVDQMLSLKQLTFQTCFLTLACMVVVCAVFIQNPISVIMATLSIASISLGVMGYLSFWHLDLDPVSLCAILISIGMAVDFVAHTAYHYQLSFRHVCRNGIDMVVPINTPYERLTNSITNIAWPMSQAGISTVICILPLVLLKNYIPLVFVKTITLVVIWGLFHGLVLLPSLLSQIPAEYLTYNCYRSMFTSSSNLKNNQELAPLSKA